MKIIFLGPQGSGKSTQAKLLADNLNLPYLEMGQLLRDRAGENDEFAEELKSTLDSGNLVENKITIEILREKLSHLSSTGGYILDGFPRNSIQYDALNEDIDLVFYVKVSDEEAVKRLMLRARSDDSNEGLKKRLEIYHSETEPLLAKFKQKGILEEIEGQRSIEQVNADILQIAKTYQK